MTTPRKQTVNTIYIIKSSATPKVYIGQTWYKLSTRLNTHKRCAKNKTGRILKLYNSMRKYGIDTFTIEKLDETDSQERANELESFFIMKYDSINNGLNLKEGGASGKYSEESKKKMSASKMGSKNNRYGIIGPDHPMYGQHHSDEAKRKISEAQTGDKHWMFGKPVTDELRSHLLEASAKARIVNAKITEDQARKIKQLLKTSMKQKDIALQCNTTHHIVSSIKRGVAWSWIKD